MSTTLFFSYIADLFTLVPICSLYVVVVEKGPFVSGTTSSNSVAGMWVVSDSTFPALPELSPYAIPIFLGARSNFLAPSWHGVRDLRVPGFLYHNQILNHWPTVILCRAIHEKSAVPSFSVVFGAVTRSLAWLEGAGWAFCTLIDVWVVFVCCSPTVRVIWDAVGCTGRGLHVWHFGSFSDW